METDQMLFLIRKYCPVCNEVHDMESHKRVVKSYIGNKDVNYTEYYYYCKNNDYEMSYSKSLKEII